MKNDGISYSGFQLLCYGLNSRPVLVCLRSGRFTIRGEVAQSQYLQLSSHNVKSANLAIILIHLRSYTLCIWSVLLVDTEVTVFVRLWSLGKATYIVLFVRCFE